MALLNTVDFGDLSCVICRRTQPLAPYEFRALYEQLEQVRNILT